MRRRHGRSHWFTLTRGRPASVRGRGLEAAVAWLYRHEAALKPPYQDNLSALIHDPAFRETTGEAVFHKVRIIQRQGNDAVHRTRPVRQFDALTVVREAGA